MAVTETVKLAGNVLQGVLMVRVEVADPPDVNVTLVGFRLAVMLEDDGVAVRLRVQVRQPSVTARARHWFLSR